MTADVTSWTPRADKDIVVRGLGARTSLGLGAPATAAAVRAGLSGLARHPIFVDRSGEPVSFAADPAMEPDLAIGERMRLMLTDVIGQALETGEAARRPDACWLALPAPRAGLPPDLRDVLVDACCEAAGVAAGSVRVVANGHAGGLMAMQAAAAALSGQHGSEILVAGVDSYHDRQTIAALDARGRLMSASNRGGFPLGEGAACCLLSCERGPFDAMPDRPAVLSGAATGLEERVTGQDAPCTGEILTAVIRAVADARSGSAERISAMVCDLNGERYRSEEFVYALLRTQDAFVDPHAYQSPADCLGDVGSASGALFLALVVEASRRGVSSGSRSVIWAGSDSGERSAVAVSTPLNEQVPR